MDNKLLHHRFIVAAALAALIITGFPLVARAGDDDITGNENSGVVVIENDKVETDSGCLSENAINIYGYHYYDTDVSEGSVTIDNSTVGVSGDSSYVYGGATTSGDVTYNEVTIDNGSTVYGDVYGGYTESGDADNNSVTITDSKVVDTWIYGGYVGTSGDANYNEVTISNSNVTWGESRSSQGYITGGYTNSDGAVTYNTVTIEDTTIDLLRNSFFIYGGSSNATTQHATGGDAYMNTVTITNSKLDSSGSGFRVIGGNSRGYSDNNKVIITNSAVGGYVVGGMAEYDYRNSDSAATNNEVEITNSTVSSYVYGGRADYGTAKYNTVKVTEGSTLNSYVMGGSGGDNADGNEVTISGGSTVSSYVVGGYVSVSGDANENSVTISEDSTVSSYVIGGYAASGDANNNEVTITDSTLGSWVAGGYTKSGDANNNSITITNSAVSSIVYGGASNGNGTANNNTVTISGAADISEASLYGSNLTSGTGNKLVIDGWSGGNTKGVYNFDSITFQNITWVTDSTLLTITGNTEIGAMANTEIILNDITLDEGATLNVGDTMTFVSGTSDTTLGIDESNVTVAEGFTKGVATVGTGEVLVDENSVAYTITGLEINPQTDIVTDAEAVGAEFVISANDLVEIILDSFGRDEMFGTKTFATVQGLSYRHDVSSSLKINGWNVIAGIGNEIAYENDRFSWALFYEGGIADFNTRNRFEDELFYGKGDFSYNGGGLAARYEKENGIYTEASMRVGHIDTSMKNALMDGYGNSYGYDTDRTYWAAHLGLGKIYNLSQKNDLNLYVKFFHTQLDGDSVVIAGDQFDLKSITSNRVRIGARIHTNKQSALKGYYGLGWEYEFDGDVDMTVAGFDGSTSFGGSSGMAEAGLTWRPKNTSPWFFDLNVRGYTGAREGGSFTVHATYTF